MRTTLVAALALVAGAAQAYEAGDMLLRGGFTTVAPDASSSELVLTSGGTPSTIAGSEADVDDGSALGITFVYMMTDKIGLEVLASTPFSHDIDANTGALGLGTVDAGETKHLPPTVSLQYFPAASDSAFQPYVGAGLNYTLFFDEKVSGTLEGVLGPGNLDLDASFGLALQAGFDYAFNEKWLVNVGVYWIDIDTDATFSFDSGDRVTTEVEIDPWVYGVSIGYRF